MTSLTLHVDGDEFLLIIRSKGPVYGGQEVEFTTCLDGMAVVTRAIVSYPVSVYEVVDMFDQFAHGRELFVAEKHLRDIEIETTQEDFAITEALNKELLSRSAGSN